MPQNAAGQPAAPSPPTVRVVGYLVARLRRGARRELADALDLLQIGLDTGLDQSKWQSTWGHLEAARHLLDQVGLADRLEQPHVEIELLRPRYLLRVLKIERDTEQGRLEDAAMEGRELPARDLLALDALIAHIRTRAGLPTDDDATHGLAGRRTPARSRRSGGHA